MGKLECSRCGGTIEKPTLKEAVESLDHAIGKTNGRPCPNDPNQYPVFWNGKAVEFKNGQPVEHVAIRTPKIEQPKPQPKPVETKKPTPTKKK